MPSETVMMKFVLFRHNLPIFVLFLFIYSRSFVIFAQTAQNDDSKQSHSETINHEETHEFNSQSIDPESQTGTSQQPEFHSDTPQHPEPLNDQPQHPESLNNQLHPDPLNDQPQQPESHSHITKRQEPQSNIFPQSTFSNDLGPGSQPQETRNFISFLTKNLLFRFPSTTPRIPYSKINHTNCWPFNVERVRLPPGYQSPINIHSSKIEKIDMPPLDTSSYEELDESAELLCFNTGHTIECKVKNGTNAPYIQGGPLQSRYIFDNMHWHWGRCEAGSEHLIDGIAYAAEVHVVHYKEKYGSFEKAKKKQDGLAIFALFAKISKNDNADLEIHFSEIHKHMLVPNTECYSKWHDVFKFIHKIVLNNQQWITYPGSLTSAPFKETVTWLVYMQLFDISKDQLDTLRSTLLANGRTHPSHRRPVFSLRGDSRPLLARKSE